VETSSARRIPTEPLCIRAAISAMCSLVSQNSWRMSLMRDKVSRDIFERLSWVQTPAALWAASGLAQTAVSATDLAAAYRLWYSDGALCLGVWRRSQLAAMCALGTRLALTRKGISRVSARIDVLHHLLNCAKTPALACGALGATHAPRAPSSHSDVPDGLRSTVPFLL